MQNQSQMCKVYTVILLLRRKGVPPGTQRGSSSGGRQSTHHSAQATLSSPAHVTLSTKPETEAFLTVLSEESICSLHVLWKQV